RGPVTVQSDVYSLGALLYYMLTGRAPFEGSDLADLLNQILNQVPRRPSEVKPNVPDALEAICLKCMEKKSADRFSSARQLALVLKAFHSDPASGSMRSADSQGRTKNRRQTLAVVVSAFVLVLVGILLSLQNFSRGRSTEPRAAAHSLPAP